MGSFYVDSVNGDDSNAGTSWTLATKTIAGGLTKVNASGSILYLASGIYREGNISLSSSNHYGLKIVGIGSVLIDCFDKSYFIYTTTAGWTAGNSLMLINLRITGWSYAAIKRAIHTETISIYSLGCTFYQCGALFQKAGLVNDTVAAHNPWYFKNCTFFGLDMSLNKGGNPAYYDFYNCILYKNINYTSTASGTQDYNASENSVHRGANGFDTSTYPPPYISDSTTSPSLGFDSSNAQFTRYMTYGKNNGVIGSAIPSSIWSNITGFETMSVGNTANPFGYWKNDEYYFSTAFNDSTIDSSNNKIDFKEDATGSELTATISSSTYTGGASLATAVQSALNSAPGKVNTYTVSYSDTTKKLTFGTNGSYYSMLWNTGTNTATCAALRLGFTTSEDSTGATSYTGTYIVKGPQGSAPADACDATYNSTLLCMVPGTVIAPLGRHCSTVGPVIDSLKENKIKRVSLANYIEGTGAAPVLYIRANPSTFLYDASSGSTELDWTALTENTDYTGSGLYRFWQVKATLNLE